MRRFFSDWRSAAGELKARQVDDLFDPERQSNMLASLVEANKGPLSGEAIVAIFQTMFQHILDIPVVSLGLGHGNNVHSPNEYYDLDYFSKNVNTAIHFYFNMAKGK